MAGITVRGPLHNASWTDDQSLIRRPRRFRVKPSLTCDLIWTALVQHKLPLKFELGSSLIDVGEMRPNCYLITLTGRSCLHIILFEWREMQGKNFCKYSDWTALPSRTIQSEHGIVRWQWLQTTGYMLTVVLERGCSARDQQLTLQLLPFSEFAVPTAVTTEPPGSQTWKSIRYNLWAISPVFHYQSQFTRARWQQLLL